MALFIEARPRRDQQSSYRLRCWNRASKRRPRRGAEVRQDRPLVAPESDLVRRGKGATSRFAGGQGAVDNVMRRHPGPTLARVLVAVEWRCLRFWIISSRNGPHQGDKLISDRSSVTGSPASAVEFNRLADLALCGTPALDIRLPDSAIAQG
jgi:hypothetical protein